MTTGTALGPFVPARIIGSTPLQQNAQARPNPMEIDTIAAKADFTFRQPRSTQEGAPRAFVFAPCALQPLGDQQTQPSLNQLPPAPSQSTLWRSSSLVVESHSSAPESRISTAEETASNLLALGRIYLDEHRYDRAIQVLTQALHNLDLLPDHRASDDTNALLCTCLGNALSGNGQLDAALETLQKGFSFLKASALTKAVLHAACGATHYKNGAFPDACRAFQQALKCPDIDAEARMTWSTCLGQVFCEMGQLEHAIIILRRARGLQGAASETQAKLLNHLGMALLNTGKRDEAKTTFQKVLGMNGVPDESAAIACEHLGNILKKEAFELFQRGANLPEASSTIRTKLRNSAEILSRSSGA